MKKRNLILGLIIAMVVVVALAEGSVYFAKYQADMALYITIIIHNVFSLFLFDPGVNIESAGEFLQQNPSVELTVLTSLYGVAVLTAQLFTATVILRAFWFGARRFFASAPFVLGKHIVIFGYNEKVEMLLANRRRDVKQKKIYIRMVVDEAFSKEKERQFLKERILIHRVGTAAEDEKSVSKLARQLGIKKATRVILFDEDAVKNISWFIRLNSLGISKNTKYYVYSTSEEIEQLLIQTQDAKPAAERAEYYFFDTDELKIQDLYGSEGTMLHTYNMAEKKREDGLGAYDVHLMIVGFGDLGQQALLHALNMGVLDCDSRIVIDVLDADVHNQKAFFENRFNPDYVHITEDEISLADPLWCDGSLQIRFHELNIRMKDFKEKIAQLGKEMPFTYVAVCLGNPEAAMHCAIEVERYLHSSDMPNGTNVPVAVRLDVDEVTLKEVRKNSEFFKELVPMKTDEDIINLDVICDAVKEQACREFNRTYNAIGDAVRYDESDFIQRVLEVKDKKDGKDDWAEKAYYKKRSNRRLYAHQKVKEWRCKGKGVYADRAFMLDMAKLEHRRWNYFTMSEGWGYTPGKKDESKKLTPYLVNWERLEKGDAAICAYDLIAVVVLQQRKEL